MICPDDIALARAVTDGADPALTSHLASCATCRAAWDDMRAVIDAARELPVAVPPPAHREEMRTALLAAAAAGLTHRRASRRWLAPAIGGAAAAAAIGYLVISRAPAPAVASTAPGHSHGTVRPHPGAHYELRSTGPDELIVLTDGAIDVEVAPLHPGERFRILVGSSALEVRGTAFTVAAGSSHLLDVAVSRGLVDLTPDIGAPTSLAAGQSWHAAPPRPVALQPTAELQPASASLHPGIDLQPASASLHPGVDLQPASASLRPADLAPPPPAASRRAASPRTAGSPPASPRASSPPPSQVSASPATASPEPSPSAPPPTPPTRAAEEISYDDAWASLRANDFPRAATGFARAVLLAPDGPLAEDAGFWRAVSLARGKRNPESISAFRDFLDTYPRAPRFAEASAMLGWLLIDSRSLDEAAQRFTAAATSPDPAIRRSARAGLDALASHPR